MSIDALFIDTLFFYPAARTTTGTTDLCVIGDQNNAGATNICFQVTVANITTSVVVRFEGSLDGVNFFNLSTGDTTITANGTTGYKFPDFPLKAVRGNLVTITAGSPTVTFVISAK